MKYEAPEAMCMSVVLKENILNGLWTEVLLHFFLYHLFLCVGIVLKWMNILKPR